MIKSGDGEALRGESDFGLIIFKWFLQGYPIV